jgi:hypothetical protein
MLLGILYGDVSPQQNEAWGSFILVRRRGETSQSTVRLPPVAARVRYVVHYCNFDSPASASLVAASAKC